MISEFIHISLKTKPFDLEALNKNSWLVLLHTNRIPPHIGLLINNNYNSLTIRGHELDVSLTALLKTITQKKIESAFIKLGPHPVFSLEHQLAIFQEVVKQFENVKQFDTSCLSPLKLFFQEFYAVPVITNELLFEFIKRLNQNSYLEYVCGINFDLPINGFELPFYTVEQLNEKIKNERLTYYKN